MITLNPENVELLCKRCHEAEHHAHFDADGHPVPENYWRG
ncbi:MAG: HNH endonuclease [Clostridia bacterium]|nr:HNH endonuclease [Clostridia bacterium]